MANTSASIIDVEKQNKLLALLKVLDINNAFDIIRFFDPDFLEGTANVWDWQYRALITGSLSSATKDKPIRVALRAANGSGKSQCTVSPWAVWNCLCNVSSQTIITTASGAQLDRQSCRYITRMCRAVNTMFLQQFGEEIFDINYRKIYNRILDSYIDMFATDEAGKAEGWHPLKVGAKFMIIVDEAKSVGNDIFDALDRCEGCTHYLLVSSPGGYVGRFYTVSTMDNTPFVIYKVTAFDCKHISKEHIDWQIKLHGEHDPLIRSSIFAEFTSTDEQVVLPREIILNCNKYLVTKPSFGPKRAGLDLSAGGDEIVLSVWQGYKLIAQECFRYSFTPLGVDMIITMIKKHDLKAENIYADDGGIGRSMIDMLYERGYKVNRVLNQSRPSDSTRYANRGTELWFNLKRYFEEYLIDLKYKDQIDTSLVDQLSSRYFKIQQTTNKLILESKQEARKKGHPSPDRADAACLAWYPYYFNNEIIKEREKSNTDGIVPKEKLEDWYNNKSLGTKPAGNVKDGRYIVPLKSWWQRVHFRPKERI